jgi:hypothetical protein
MKYDIKLLMLCQFSQRFTPQSIFPGRMYIRVEPETIEPMTLFSQELNRVGCAVPAAYVEKDFHFIDTVI